MNAVLWGTRTLDGYTGWVYYASSVYPTSDSYTFIHYVGGVCHKADGPAIVVISLVDEPKLSYEYFYNGMRVVTEPGRPPALIEYLEMLPELKMMAVLDR